MTTCTPIYDLPVVEGTDNPCDIGDTICAIAERVETQLDRLDALVDRTATTVPMLKVASTISQTFSSSSPFTTFAVNWDTVLVDTDDMFNSGFPSTITFNRTGIWLISCNIMTHSTGAGGLQLSHTISVVSPIPPIPGWGSLTAVSANQNFPSPLDIYSNSSATFPLIGTGDGFVQVSFFPNGTDTITMFYADASLAWLGDLT